MINSLSAGVRFGIGLLSVPVLVRLLGLGRFGEWSLVQAVIGLAVLAELGLTSALSVRLSAARSSDDELFSGELVTTSAVTLTVLGLVASVPLVIFAGPLVERIATTGTSAELIEAAAIASAGLLLRLWQLWFVGFEAAHNAYGVQAKAETAALIVTNLGSILVAAIRPDLRWLAGWSVASSAAACVLHLILAKRAGLTFRFGHFSRRAFDGLAGFGWRHWLTNIGGILYTRADRVVVFGVLGDRAAGLYAACVSVVSRINDFSAIPIQPLVPLLSESIAVRDTEGARNLFALALRRLGAIVMVLAGGVIAFAPVISLIMLGTRSSEFESLLLLMAATYATYSLAGAGHYANLGLSRPGTNAWIVLLLSTGTLVAIRMGGATGGLLLGAAGNAVFCALIVLNFIAGRELGYALKSLLTWHVGVVAFLGLAVGVALLIGKLSLGLWASSGVGLLLFAACVTAAGLLSPDDASMVLQRLRLRPR